MKNLTVYRMKKQLVQSSATYFFKHALNSTLNITQSWKENIFSTENRTTEYFAKAVGKFFAIPP